MKICEIVIEKESYCGFVTIILYQGAIILYQGTILLHEGGIYCIITEYIPDELLTTPSAKTIHWDKRPMMFEKLE
jgi:hypothetical protein